MEIKRTVHE